jgi:outer membrane protein assembly factor BamB
VYFSARDGYFYCISTSGKGIWRTQTGGIYDDSSPTVVDGRIYFSSGFPNKDFFCLKASDGSLAWRTPSGNAMRPGQFAYASPAVVGNVVYTAANDAVFYALNTSDGGVKWRFESSGTVDYFSPTVYKGRVYCAPGELNPNLFAVDAKTGAEVWHFAAAGQYFYISSPAASNNLVYYGSGSPDHVIYAINAANGQEKWHYKIGFSGVQGWTSSPAIAKNLLLVGAGPDTSQGDQNGRLVALDAVTGSLRWKDTLPKPVVASPTVANGRVFVGAMNGVMYGYRSAGAQPLNATPPKTKKGASSNPKAKGKARTGGGSKATSNSKTVKKPKARAKR